MARFATKDVITPAGVKVLAALAALKSRPHVKVGVLQADFDQPKAEDKAMGKGKNAKPPQFAKITTLGVVAVANEFGTDTIPERSFIRSTHDENAEKWREETDKLREKVIEGSMSTEVALKRLGTIIKSAIQAKIRSNIPPPNAPETEARKHSSNTLINTGQLLNGIDYEVHLEGGRK